MALSVQDLLFAHGCLCAYARSDEAEFEDIEHAIRVRDTINNFQAELKDHLIPDAKSFEVVSTTFNFGTIYTVCPKGGW